MCAWTRGGSEEGGKDEGEVGGPVKPIASVHGLWVRLQVSTKYM